MLNTAVGTFVASYAFSHPPRFKTLFNAFGMFDGLCVRCGEKIEGGRVFAIRPTICCARCCWQFPSHCGIYRGVSTHAARYKYGCSKGDLRFLNSTTLVNTDAGNVVVFLYLEAEVDFLGKLRDKYPMKLSEDMILTDIAARQEKRRTEVKNMLPRPWPERQTVYEKWILRDYVENPRKLGETIDDVLQRYAFIGRAEHIVQECKVDFQTAARFCTDHEGGPAEFDALRVKCRTVFELVGHRILRHLTHEERERLADTPLAFALVKFRSRTAKPETRGAPEKTFYDNFLPSRKVVATVPAAADADLNVDASSSEEDTDEDFFDFFSSDFENTTVWWEDSNDEFSLFSEY